MEKIKCTIERITFQNPENGYSVLQTAIKGYFTQYYTKRFLNNAYILYIKGIRMVELNRCCANLGIKKVKVLKINTLTLAFVGITGLEPATSRPPDVCATNCAKSRKRMQRYEVFLIPANFWLLF